MKKLVLARRANQILIATIMLAGVGVMLGVFAYIAYPPLRTGESLLLLGASGLPACALLQLGLRRRVLRELTLTQSLLLGAQPCLGTLSAWIGAALLLNAWADRAAPTDVQLPVLAKSTRSTKHGLMYVVAVDEPVPSNFGWSDHESIAVTRAEYERLRVGEARVDLSYKPGFLGVPWRVHAALVPIDPVFSKEAVAEAVAWSERFDPGAVAEAPPAAPGNVRRELYPDGRVRSEEPVLDGQIHGLATYTFANRQLYGRIPYVHGKKHGRFILFHENGTRDQILSYRDGQLHGVCEWFNDADQPIKKWVYVEGRPAKELPL